MLVDGEQFPQFDQGNIVVEVVAGVLPDHRSREFRSHFPLYVPGHGVHTGHYRGGDLQTK